MTAILRATSWTCFIALLGVGLAIALTLAAVR
jgi:hypothetical protein